MSHPSSLALESYACGESLGEPELAHVEGCAECRAFVEELRGLVGPTAKEAEAAVARALEGVSTEVPAVPASLPTELPAASPPAEVLAPVVPLHAARTGGDRAPAPQAAKRRLWAIATSVVTPLAAAAIILFVLRSAPPAEPVATPPAPAAATQPAPPDTIQLLQLPSASEPDTRFKGGMQIAVVRERGGRQARFSSALHVKPGDRIRVEVALDHEQAIVGAVLGDDGSYLEIMPQGVRGAGTHFSERSARIDASPTSGTIVIGSPEAVARARATKQLTDVSTLRVEWEQP